MKRDNDAGLGQRRRLPVDGAAIAVASIGNRAIGRQFVRFHLIKFVGGVGVTTGAHQRLGDVAGDTRAKDFEQLIHIVIVNELRLSFPRAKTQDPLETDRDRQTQTDRQTKMSEEKPGSTDRYRGLKQGG